MHPIIEDIDADFISREFRNIFQYSLESPWFFTEFSFLFVFAAFLLFYALLNNKGILRKIYLVLFSLFFYYKSSGPYLGLFVLMIISDYFFALWMDRSEGIKRKIYLTLAIFYSLSFLLYFKYSNFFILNSNYLFDSNFNVTTLFLPIGISFYTFQSISYVVDVYRKKITPCKSFLNYSFYMTFFPHLVAGPIVRASDFLYQVDSPSWLNNTTYKESVFRVTCGLVKKLLFADYLGQYVDMVHSTPEGYSGAEHLISMYAYTFQIYFDFSGYSDIAIGIALMLGYRLNENFSNPYAAANITEFWRRWHISLSSWLKDYIYIPLGGNRKGKLNTYLFLIATMLIGGFWHGADWRFVIWGGAHGLALALHKYIKELPRFKDGKGYNFLGILFTFNFVAACWIFFRATSFEDAFCSFTKILQEFQWNDFILKSVARPELSILILISALVAFFPNKWKTAVFQKVYQIPTWLWIFILAFSLQVIVQFREEVVQPFIYFQF